MVLLLSSLVAITGGIRPTDATSEVQGDLSSEKLSAASGSNRFVVWEDASGQIFFKRSTDNGITWKPTVNLSKNAGDSKSPQIVVSGSNVYVTWRQHPVGFTSADVFFRGSTNNGATWGAKINISSDSGAYDSLPQIAASGNGVYITWHDAAKEVFVRHSLDKGVSWKPKVNLSSNPGPSTGPEIAVFESNVYIAWYQEDIGGNVAKGNAFLRISKNSGASWGPKVNVSSDSDTTRSGDPDIAASGGKIYVVWSDGGFIEFRASTDNGVTWKSIISISDNKNGNQDPSDTADSPQIVVSGSNIHVTWVGNCCDIFYKRSTDGGVTWKSSKNLSNTAGNSRYQDMTVSGSNVYVTWIESVADGSEIMFRRSIDSGATWKSSKNLSSDAAICGGWSSRMAVSGFDVYVVFSSKPPFNSDCEDAYGTYITDIYLKRSTNGGATWKTLKNLSNDKFDSWNPQIAS
jgi:hypothetical protein